MNVFFNLRKDFKCAINDFMYMLLSVRVQDVKSKVQDVETNGNPVNSTAISH